MCAHTHLVLHCDWLSFGLVLYFYSVTFEVLIESDFTFFISLNGGCSSVFDDSDISDYKDVLSDMKL